MGMWGVYMTRCNKYYCSCYGKAGTGLTARLREHKDRKHIQTNSVVVSHEHGKTRAGLPLMVLKNYIKHYAQLLIKPCNHKTGDTVNQSQSSISAAQWRQSRWDPAGPKPLNQWPAPYNTQYWLSRGIEARDDPIWLTIKQHYTVKEVLIQDMYI